MNINNPTTFSTPDLTLSTSNSSGTAGALRADDTILVYDTTLPAIVASSAATGSAGTSARRDHQHAGIVGEGTFTDNAVVLFSGTGGVLLQQCSSNVPIFSDAGVLTIPAGQIVFPATQAASSGANDFDDYEEGTFTPFIEDAAHGGATSKSQTYTTQVGVYTKIGNVVNISLRIEIDSLGTLSGACFIGGLPFTARSLTSYNASLAVGGASSLAITAGQNIVANVGSGQSFIDTNLWNSLEGTNVLQISQLSAGGRLMVAGHYDTGV